MPMTSSAARRAKPDPTFPNINRARNGIGNLALSARDVAQGAVRLDMRHTHALCPGTGIERSDLIDEHGFKFGQGNIHAPPPETLQIGETRMRTDTDAMRFRQTDGIDHDQGIAGMVAAGDVGAGDDF